MANHKIPVEAEAVILKLAGGGKTTRQIAAAIGKSHGVKLVHGTIANFIERHRQARAETAKTVVREKLASALTGDLDELELERAGLARMARTVREEIEAGDAPKAATLRYLRIVDRLAKITDLKLHYAGADTPDDKPTDDAASTRVLDRIAALLDSTEAPKPTLQ